MSGELGLCLLIDSCFYLKKLGVCYNTFILGFSCHAGGMVMADIDELKKKLEDGWIKGEPYVFVSYASKDKEKVYEFVYELRNAELMYI